MKKWIALIVVAVLALLGWIAAGPFMTVHAIREAIRTQDTAELSRHVDFPMLRANLRAQLDDYLARQAGPDLAANPLGALALRLASGATGGMVDTIATPAGLAAVLEGRQTWHRLSGAGVRADDSYAHQPPPDPLQGAKYGFESTSRFTATVDADDGQPVTFVLSRDGLEWKLSDVRLPLGGDR